MWTVVAVSCVCGVVVTYVRLAILAETTASTFAVFGSVALMPVRVRKTPCGTIMTPCEEFLIRMNPLGIYSLSDFMWEKSIIE